MNDKVAFAELICIANDGRESQVTVWIGQPYKAETGEWRCPVGLVGLYDRLPDIAGEDSLQALFLAGSLLRTLLDGFVANGGRVLYASDRRSCYPIGAVFGTVGRESGDTA